MKKSRPTLEVYSTPQDKRLYPAYAVNLQDMRRALKRVAAMVSSGELKLSRTDLNTYASNFLKAKISGCTDVIIDPWSRKLFIKTQDALGAPYEYVAYVPPEWPS